MSSTPAGQEKASSARATPQPAAAHDTHPYVRGSVIEVWYIPKNEDADDDEWFWTDSEDEENDNDGKLVRLCDIIDRIQKTNAAGETEYRYYVHYRDFNRRMDEWIGVERIVSPPSVGNAKVRAQKKNSEKRKTPPVEETNTKRKDARRGRRKQDTAESEDDNEAEGDAETKEDASKKETVSLQKGVATHTTDGGHVVTTVRAQELDEHEGFDDQRLREHEEVTKVKNVNFLEMGAYQMETWYYSPLPKELVGPSGLMEVLYVCEFTMSLFQRKIELQRFQARLPVEKRHPPGDEIYRKGNLAMFEVDAYQEETYCQNLSYIAKLFLDHKTLYYSVSPFLFYVLCEVDERGCHPCGYFSKEKYSDLGYNLACILTFPAHQRKGYGRFLIAFSYELSKKEKKVGSPEKPMSDLGQQAYKPYWASTILDFLLNQSDERTLSIMEISKVTSILSEDIVFTLNQMGLLKIVNGVFFIAGEKSLLQGLAKKFPIKEPRVDPSKLHWTPYLSDVKRDKFSIQSKRNIIPAD